MTNDIVRVRARIRLLPSQESGRTQPVRAGYRPNHNFFGPEDRTMTMGIIELADGFELHPGESVETTVRFQSWPGLEGQIHPGREWRIQEGARLVGIGTVIGILNAPG
jgi:elongation factor Tu